MTTFDRLALAAVFALGLTTAAQAQSTSLSPTVPNPANPYPLNPVATDGTPLPRYNGVTTHSGRSAAAPLGGVVGTGTGIAGRALDTGVRIFNGLGGDVLR